MRSMWLFILVLLVSPVFKINCEFDTGKAEKEQKKMAVPSRYGDPLRNLPSWEWEMIQDGRSSEEIDKEWNRRYRDKRK